MILAAALHRTAGPERAPERLARAVRGSQKLPHRHEFIQRERDHQRHRQCRQQAERTPGANGNRLDDHEIDADNPQRQDQEPQRQHHPRHGAPAILAAHERHHQFQRIDHCTQARIGNWPGFGHRRGDDRLGAVQAICSGKERLPYCVRMAHLIGRHVAGDQKAEQRQGTYRHPLQPACRVIAPFGRDIGLAHHAIHAHPRHHRDQYR